MADVGDAPPRKEIYTYAAPWTIYAMAWSRRYVVVSLLCRLGIKSRSGSASNGFLFAGIRLCFVLARARKTTGKAGKV